VKQLPKNTITWPRSTRATRIKARQVEILRTILEAESQQLKDLRVSSLRHAFYSAYVRSILIAHQEIVD
jgi:hypothetical protein